MDPLITANDIKKEIDDEVEIPVTWIQDFSNEVDPLADVKAEEVEGTEDLHFPKVLIPDFVPKVEASSSSALFHDCPIKSDPNPLEVNIFELEVIKDLVSFQDIKPNLSLKEEDGLSNHDCKIEYEGDFELQETGIIQDLLPKIKIEAPPRVEKRELRILLKRISVPDLLSKVVPPCEVRETDNKKNKTRNIEEGETLAPKSPSGSTYRKNLKTSSFNVNVPKGKQYNAGNTFKCKECLYTSARSDLLKLHMRTHTGERPFKCKECVYTSASSGVLKEHMSTHTGERPFKCNLCSHTSARSRALKQHMKTHTGERPFKCNLCSHTSARLRSLNLHMRIHTGERPFQCNKCFHTYACSGALRKHMRKHTGERPFKCNKCLYTGTELHALKVHMRTHTGERPFKCNECLYTSALLGPLRVHMRTHTGERPFKCKECSHASNSSGDLNRHMITHTGERHFECKECSRTFAFSGSLKIHMRTHTGERPFECKECLYTGAHLSNLNRHMRRTHTGERP